MQKRILKYSLIVMSLAFLGYQSVYFKKLSTKKNPIDTNLQPAEFAKKFWETEFVSYKDSALEITTFLKQYTTDPDKTYAAYNKSDGIGSSAFFLLKGEGVISEINTDAVLLQLQPTGVAGTIKISTGKYFGNAIRDVSGKIKMGDFKNTMDYNLVAAELNKMVDTQVVLPFKQKAVKGATIKFIGCATIPKGPLDLLPLEIIPVQLKY